MKANIKNSKTNVIRQLLIVITLLGCSLTQGSELRTQEAQADRLLHQLRSLSVSADKMTLTLMLYHHSQKDPRYKDGLDTAKDSYLSFAKSVYTGLTNNQLPIKTLKEPSKRFYRQYQTTMAGAQSSDYISLANTLLQNKNGLNKAINSLSEQLQQASNSRLNQTASLAREQARLLQQMTEFYMTMHLGLENPNPQFDMDEQSETFSLNHTELKDMLKDEEFQAWTKVIEKKWSFIKRSVAQRSEKGTPEMMQRFSVKVVTELLEISNQYSGNNPVEVAAENP